MGKLASAMLRTVEHISTQNAEEIMDIEFTMSGSSSIRITMIDTGFTIALFGGKRKIIQAVGNDISQALKNLELVAIEFLGQANEDV